MEEEVDVLYCDEPENKDNRFCIICENDSECRSFFTELTGYVIIAIDIMVKKMSKEKKYKFVKPLIRITNESDPDSDTDPEYEINDNKEDWETIFNMCYDYSVTKKKQKKNNMYILFLYLLYFYIHLQQIKKNAKNIMV